MATSVRRTAKWRALSARAQATYNAIERDCKASRYHEVRESRYWGAGLDELIATGLVVRDDRGPGWPWMLYIAEEHS
ncbi:MAG TPA: hypothetical protein PKD55_08815 [Bellilinea sp.]|nr:hypothetical protein [Bellilinea sp.]